MRRFVKSLYLTRGVQVSHRAAQRISQLTHPGASVPIVKKTNSPRLLNRNTRRFNAMATTTTNGVTKKDIQEELTSTLSRLGIKDMPSFPNTYPSINQMDIFRAHIAGLIAPITGADPKVAYSALQWTQTLDKGDLVLPVPALRLKGKKPDETAKAIDEQFPESLLVEKPIVAGTFVQFFVKSAALIELVVPAILQSGENYGFNSSLGLKNPNDSSKGRKTVVVEFSSPNIAKPFHAGHLRSTIIGGFLSNLHEKAGWDVVRLNYLGDWGKQYGVLILGYQKFGSAETLEQNPIGHLYDVYVKISTLSTEEQTAIKAKKEKIKELQGKNESVTEMQAEVQALDDKSIDQQARDYFKRMSDGDPEALATWKKLRDLSITKYKQTYSRLNIQYDLYDGESMVSNDTIDRIARELEEKGVSEKSEGAVIIDLTKHSKKLGKAVVQKKDGTSLYLTRDISAVVERMDRYHFDRMIYVVASQQDLHFAQLFKIEEVMGRKDISEKCIHINFGMVRGMSTRKGTAKFLDDILRDVGEKMHEVMKTNQAKYEQVTDPDRTADILGISAVMVQDMMGKRVNDYDFDMNRMTSFEGDTGPYLQYAHARLCSIARKAEMSETDVLDADLSLLKEKHAVDLVRALAQWPDVFLNTVKTQEPTTVLTYLFKMAKAISSSYDHLQVVGSEPELKKARMALYICARHVLFNGMRLLGLSPVIRM